MPTRSQIDAERALDDVQHILDSYPAGAQERKRYASLVQRFPVMVRDNGLLAAFGFLHAKAEGNADSVEGRLASQLAGALGLAGDFQEVEQYLATLQLPEYMILTRRALELTGWYKRQTEARIESGEDEHATPDA